MHDQPNALVNHPRPPVVMRWACGLAMASAAFGSMAQYKVVGPDGRVTYTDQPPSATAGAEQRLPAGAPTPTATGGGLPADLRALVNRYPVVLHTMPNCRPCDTARQYLVQRGIPFEERTVTTASDAQAMTRLNPGGSMPLLLIGQQRLLGWVVTDWASYLDAAGYPATSRLPASYRPSAPRPLAPPAPAQPASAPQWEDIRRPLPPDPADEVRPAGSGPAIRF